MDALEAEHDENECRLNFSMSVGSCGPFEAEEAAIHPAPDLGYLLSEFGAVRAENRRLKREIRTLLDTMRCAGDVLQKLIKESK